MGLWSADWDFWVRVARTLAGYRPRTIEIPKSCFRRETKTGLDVLTSAKSQFPEIQNEVASHGLRSALRFVKLGLRGQGGARRGG